MRDTKANATPTATPTGTAIPETAPAAAHDRTARSRKLRTGLRAGLLGLDGTHN